MIRIGQGYDVHRFSTDPNRPCILGGVTIEHNQGLEGHSDADVLAHAIADAIFGALGEPDIGYWFPPGDPSCKDINSLKIVAKARLRAEELGMRIVNIDSTLIAEAPKILPHIAAMKQHLGSALALAPADIGIKATTNETMGFVGRKEGIAALAVALVEKQ